MPVESGSGTLYYDSEVRDMQKGQMLEADYIAMVNRMNDYQLALNSSTTSLPVRNLPRKVALFHANGKASEEFYMLNNKVVPKFPYSVK